MAIKKTLAQNHLSELASKGRGGDTELRFIDGELSHVNPGEASLADTYGSLGEDVVKFVGSGGINPNTGLREYVVEPVTSTLASTVGAGAMIGQGVLGAYSAWKGGSEDAAQARLESSLFGQTIESYDKALKALPAAKESKMDIRRSEFSFGLEGLSANTGISKEDLTKKMGETIKKSNLATSGTIEGKQSTVLGRIQGAFKRGKEGLMGQLGKGMAEVEEWFAGETSRIEGAKKTAQIQKDAADKKAGGWYLGKNIENLFS